MRDKDKHSAQIYCELNILHDSIAEVENSDSPELDSLLAAFEKLLHLLGENNESIAIQKHWVLLFERKKDARKEISHRMLEIESIERLFLIGGPVKHIDYKYLNERYKRLIQCLILDNQTDRANVYVKKMNEIRSRGESQG